MPCPDIVADLERFPDKISVVNAGSLHLQYNPEGKILSCIDTDLGEAYYHAADVGQLPDYEICTPMRMLFNWSCAMHGVLMVHAAAVGKHGIGALIVGKSGAGKSTTALQCLLNGLDYLGDDYVAVNSDDGTVHHLYRGCKVMDDALERLPVLAPHVIMHNRPNRKSVVILDDTLGALVPSFRLVAIIRPRVAKAAGSNFSPLSPRQAVAEFAASTILQMPGTGSYMLRELSKLCARVSAFEMSLSTEPAEIAQALDDFLQQYSTT
ncbi:protein of unknown function [Sterolibacterium denitrificans]|uniref:AAA+ ATPase domain-containing protein n=1 Tax=Sterolibacterium denitrificans TaxID=157592 RepID=A0A7Z7HPU0_9PROT|nr:hypothetical protein [Sterolibacterium denitrificans]SMB22403.1 protein of unknown function [Sterolibacterium denitrificans]